jgi:hypothetical protein
MNLNKAVQHESDSCSAPVDVDATLRLVASLPAPQGLEDRVHAALRSAPRRGARVIQWPGDWPAGFRTDSAWMRSAAAAAIVFVVVGGGWGVYSRVQPPKVIAMPSHVGAPGGFSSGGAMRTPQTLNGPVINHPAANQSSRSGSTGTAAAPHVVQMPVRKGEHDASANKSEAPVVK